MCQHHVTLLIAPVINLSTVKYCREACRIDIVPCTTNLGSSEGNVVLFLNQKVKYRVAILEDVIGKM